MTKTVRAADILARRLYAAGCRHAFGMPGGEVLTLVDALEAAGIRFHLTRHENAAGFMAEGVHHMDGAPAILVATVGPGAMNAVNVVANAEQDRVPLIMLTGCVDAAEVQTYTHQILDHRAVFEPITKATFTLDAAAAGVIAEKAVGIATEGRPGPVHIDVPISVADAPGIDMSGQRVAASAAVPATRDLETARAWLKEAKRPVLIAGLDILYDDSVDALRALVEKHNVPVITSYKAKGVLPEDHPLSLGGAGLSPLADRHLLPLIAEADLIICAGYDPIEMRTGWRDPWDPAKQNVIDIHAAPNHHFMHQATLSFIAHTGETLNALSDGVDGHQTWADGRIDDLRAALSNAFADSEDWGPAAVIAECRTVLPRDTVATVDSGAHRILLSQMWRSFEPRGLLQSTGLCTMGCALPLAMGAKLAAPERPVVGFTGDAGFLMVAGELSSAAEMGLNTIFVVFVDESLALIDLKQRQRQLTNNGVDFIGHDYAAIARAFGGHGVTANNRSDLRSALKNALNADTFTLIAAHIDRHAYDGRI
ncbi:MAG: thiamine pyrophosphate-binding protein [Ahrensia sp.]|nr:thiamine pyrophosphate-binding protein [Ahrensia sp.]